MLGDIIEFLLTQPDYGGTLQDLQREVWKQSLNLHGWKQKIRNALMRVRGMIPCSMAPFIIHHHNIRLNGEAIRIHPQRKSGNEREDEIFRLLKHRSMTSGQLSERLDISRATTKRVLNNMAKKDKIEHVRTGRQIFYRNKKKPVVLSHFSPQSENPWPV